MKHTTHTSFLILLPILFWRHFDLNTAKILTLFNIKERRKNENASCLSNMPTTSFLFILIRCVSKTKLVNFVKLWFKKYIYKWNVFYC